MADYVVAGFRMKGIKYSRYNRDSGYNKYNMDNRYSKDNQYNRYNRSNGYNNDNAKWNNYKRHGGYHINRKYDMYNKCNMCSRYSGCERYDQYNAYNWSNWCSRCARSYEYDNCNKFQPPLAPRNLAVHLAPSRDTPYPIKCQWCYNRIHVRLSFSGSCFQVSMCFDHWASMCSYGASSALAGPMQGLRTHLPHPTCPTGKI
jgi:hypothetical protein